MGRDPAGSDPRPGSQSPLDGFSPLSPTRIFWNSRKRRGMKEKEDDSEREKMEMDAAKIEELQASPLEKDKPELEQSGAFLSEKRKALFEPLEPLNANGRRPLPAESLLPPPDFDSAVYPRGWLIGKKRKLVNVDVVESMRRIAVQEMNRKDREINGLNEQLEEDARCLEHLQLQLREERSKRSEVERENSMLQDQISMLMNMLQEHGAMEEGEEVEDDGHPQ
ncbi:protein HEADING DATE REPRESSOR 1 isoform X1 [Nymphaea colorata]|nr:protein HEADING DATE REPRESSOR 1 isoform X1 [Nymphaea colorata]